MSIRMHLAALGVLAVTALQGLVTLDQEPNTYKTQELVQLDPMFGINGSGLVQTAQLDPMFGLSVQSSAAA